MAASWRWMGASSAALVRERYGTARYQEHRNDFHRDGRGLVLIELGKWGLGRKDLVANLNFFSKVVVDGEGRMAFVTGHSQPGASVDLRAEMDTLVVLNTCPHPLDPNPEWAPRPMEPALYRTVPAADDDPWRLGCPENGRAFANTALCPYPD